MACWIYTYIIIRMIIQKKYKKDDKDGEVGAWRALPALGNLMSTPTTSQHHQVLVLLLLLLLLLVLVLVLHMVT